MLEKLNELSNRVKGMNDHEAMLALHHIIGAYSFRSYVSDKYPDVFKDTLTQVTSFISALLTAIETNEEIRAQINSKSQAKIVDHFGRY